MHHFDEYDPGGFEEEATWKFCPAVRLAKASLNLQLHGSRLPESCSLRVPCKLLQAVTVPRIQA